MNVDYGYLSKLLIKIAPDLAQALLGPYAKIVISLLMKAFGVKEEDLGSAIMDDPESALKIKALEMEHGEVLAALEVKDRMDARASSIEGQYEWFVHLLSVIVILGFFIAVLCMFTVPEKTQNHDILNMMLGVLGTSFVQVLSFYFGNIKRN